MGDTNRQAPEVRRRPFLQVVLLALASAVAALWVILPFARSVRQQDLPAAAQPLDWEYRSVTLPAWSKDGYYDSAPALDEIAASGADSVTFVATWYAVDERDSEILRAGRTASDASLVWAFKEAKARGLRVILKPHVDLENGNWRAYIDPRDPDRWFQQYTDLMNHYAELGSMHNVQVLSIGAELISLSTNPAYEGRWRDLIAGLRERFPGRLTYSANWGGGYFAEPGFADEMSRLPFWDALGYLGISAYFTLADTTTPTVQQMKDRWATWRAQTIDAFHQRWNKPVLFIEGGYRSADGTAREPFNSWSIWPLDTQEQVDTYEALFQTWSGVSWFAGTALWAWNINTQVSPTDIWYEVQNKPAQQTVLNWFGGTTTQPPGPPTIQIRNPQSNQSYTGVIAVTAFATNVVSVRYRVDEQAGVPLTFAASSGLWQGSLDTRNVPNGYHHVTVTGQASDGTTVEDRAWNIIIQNAAASPSPSPTPAPSPTPTPTAAPTPTPSAAVTPSPTASPSASLAPATNLSASRTGSPTRPRIDLSWTGSAGATSYRIERSTDASFSTSLVVAEVAAPTTRCRDETDLAPNTFYYYRVIARSATQTAPPSNVASASTR